jgi:hypothetical protein
LKEPLKFPSFFLSCCLIPNPKAAAAAEEISFLHVGGQNSASFLAGLMAFIVLPSNGDHVPEPGEVFAAVDFAIVISFFHRLSFPLFPSVWGPSHPEIAIRLGARAVCRIAAQARFFCRPNAFAAFGAKGPRGRFSALADPDPNRVRL